MSNESPPRGLERTPESDEVLLVGKSKPALSDALADQKKRGSMVLKRNKLSKTSSHKLHSSVYSKKQITAAIRIQKWYRVRRLMSAIETALFFNKRRRAILKEILATEESYLASLTVLSTQFMDQLKSFFSEVELMNVFIGVKVWKGKVRKETSKKKADLSFPSRSF